MSSNLKTNLFLMVLDNQILYKSFFIATAIFKKISHQIYLSSYYV